MKIQLEDHVIQQIRDGQGPIELVDRSGHTVGVVRRPPTDAEIERARMRASQGGPTLTWGQLMAKVREETGL